jgi:DNA (cytosine-5)-methyltransferase 1
MSRFRRVSRHRATNLPNRILSVSMPNAIRVWGKARMFTFYEFFAGGGMARAALQPQWRCIFANDFDLKKSATYRRNWGDGELVTGDVGKLTIGDLPAASADLAWASFPCQDLSLAGGGAGLKGDRSGTFWPFWHLMQAIAEAFQQLGYSVGAVVIDAKLFLPQSRPRLFFVGVKRGLNLPAGMVENQPDPHWHPRGLVRAHAAMGEQLQQDWLWWKMPAPPARKTRLLDIIEEQPLDVRWHSPEETQRILDMMAPIHRAKIAKAAKSGKRTVGTVYRRTRPTEPEGTIQRAEIRFDDIAGCLRTPAGGSSRQTLLFVEGRTVRSRLISARETARLMGLPESYILPDRYNEAYHLTGDGVAVDAVRYISEHILIPAVNAALRRKAA